MPTNKHANENRFSHPEFPGFELLSTYCAISTPHTAPISMKNATAMYCCHCSFFFASFFFSSFSKRFSDEIPEYVLMDAAQKFYANLITPLSKLVLKKMIDYARKYSEGIVKNYIPFNMRIYADNDETLYDIVNLIIDSFTYFGYMKNDSAVERSFYIVEDGSHITDLYSPAHSLVIFKDIAGMLNKDKATQDKLLKIWEKE